mmetsp:Transcript_62236/g.116482  ORF Transcript_62236/g.116482 Transcript_62236/m.116482 type:complete len:223 (-) Transcript_62236:222-890(-)
MEPTACDCGINSTECNMDNDSESSSNLQDSLCSMRAELDRKSPKHDWKTKLLEGLSFHQSQWRWVQVALVLLLLRVRCRRQPGGLSKAASACSVLMTVPALSSLISFLVWRLLNTEVMAEGLKLLFRRKRRRGCHAIPAKREAIEAAEAACSEYPIFGGPALDVGYERDVEELHMSEKQLAAMTASSVPVASGFGARSSGWMMKILQFLPISLSEVCPRRRR